ncbi:MacB family efflux pump subunit [Aureimonas populi]|uniref:Pyoverdine export ATP-binding/permease protein PvdT n=1 Tax=Aureimonas populi TaxID=1701758 RepID=A0ABW5CJR3_9HYPH|nr:MacB family efflux pump subunit [Aureimonas populi]
MLDRPHMPATAAARTELRLEGVRKSYPSGGERLDVLKGISLSIGEGEFVAIIGQSGSGKSTLMNILGCLDRPSAGRYFVGGRDVSELEGDELAALRRDIFGFIFQSYHLVPGASARENVELPAIYAGLGADERAERAERLLTLIGLGERMDHRPNQLSGGQQQRVSISRALMNGGSVILADEPTGALDTASGREVMALLRSLNADGHTVIVITHDPKIAAQADRLIEIEDGEIVSDTPSPEAGARAARASPAPPASAPPARRAASALAGLGEAVRMAFRSLAASPLRTALTLLGMVIGVAAVIVMLAIGNGSRQDVVERISAMGTNQILVRPGAPGQRVPGGVVATLVPADARAIAGLDNVAAVVPEIQGSVTARAGGADHQTTVTATWPDFSAARSWPVASGSFLEEEDEAGYAPVAVLGKTVRDALFAGGDDPIGQYVLLNNNPFLIVGVMGEMGASTMGSDQDDAIFVPLSTGSLRLFGQTYLRSLTVMVEDVSRISQTESEVQALLDGRHGTRDTNIRNMSSLLEAVQATAGTMTVLLGSVAAISLLVGGIGIMNIMLVNVTERTREIGIRMATGARQRDILRQFSTEAVVVSGLGGALGCLLGLGVSLALKAFGLSLVVTAGPFALAFGSAFLTGLVFGWLPARKAAGLDPAVALSGA